ncbi:MAG TPA: DNA-formamidopyrimidine glycosylase family protein [Chitinophagaceae bacterium]|nr:DNA-formamidopyrimidine glycosylase family protein [Chitinophagaceae bacterium]
MPEGPSIIILKEIIEPLLRKKKITAVAGNAKFEKEELTNKKLQDIRSWGKQLFLCFPGMTVRIHFLLFGTYSIDERTKPVRSLRLSLSTEKHTVYFYSCSVKPLAGNLDDLYDWEADVLSDKWSPAKARKKLKEMPAVMVCDALLDQNVFAGVGNIIKNEVLYRIHLHPETRIKAIPPRLMTLLIKEARHYSFDFLKWKKEFTLKKHWLAHTKKTCIECEGPLTKKYCGKTKRRSFFCTNCQVKYK